MDIKINKFEQDVDSLINKMNIYKNNWNYLLQIIFTVFEYRVEKINHQKNSESLFHTELTILDRVIKLCSKHENETIRRDADINKVNTFFENVYKYLEIENNFILSKNGYLNISIEKSNVYFTNIKIDETLEIINFYNKLNFAENYRHRFFKYSTNDTSHTENLIKDFRKGIENIREYKENFLLKNDIYINEVYDIYAILIFFCSIIKNFNKFDDFIIEEDKLLNRIRRITKLDDNKIKDILLLLSYETGQKIDIIHTPLFHITDSDGNKCFITTPSLIINSNIERNILVLIQEKLKIKPYDGLQEIIMCNHIKEKISCYDNLHITSNIKLLDKSKKIITDIDLLIFDDNTNSCICCELKNFLYADSLQQHLNIQGRKDDEQLNKAYEQVRLTKNYFGEDFDGIVAILKYRGISIDEKTKLEFIVVSSNNLGYYSKHNINIVDTNNFIDLCVSNAGDLQKVIKNIQQNIFSQNIHCDYICEDKKIEFAGYKITYPYYYINHFGKVI
ncbi:MAG: hypothetical protein E7248_11750 [Paenibacillaceae bacterium]|nr:hypothetical protein [Paenibacillaceae bacterium]